MANRMQLIYKGKMSVAKEAKETKEAKEAKEATKDITTKALFTQGIRLSSFASLSHKICFTIFPKEVFYSILGSNHFQKYLSRYLVAQNENQKDYVSYWFLHLSWHLCCRTILATGFDNWSVLCLQSVHFDVCLHF